MVNACYLSYLRGLRFEINLGKKLARLYLNKQARHGGPPSYKEVDQGSRLVQEKNVRLYLKNKTQLKEKRADGMVQVPSKYRPEYDPSTAEGVGGVQRKKREGKKAHAKTEAETGVMQPQAKACLGPQRLERSRKNPSQ
jgi:hypothetical protein